MSSSATNSTRTPTLSAAGPQAIETPATPAVSPILQTDGSPRTADSSSSSPSPRATDASAAATTSGAPVTARKADTEETPIVLTPEVKHEAASKLVIVASPEPTTEDTAQSLAEELELGANLLATPEVISTEPADAVLTIPRLQRLLDSALHNFANKLAKHNKDQITQLNTAHARTIAEYERTIAEYERTLEKFLEITPQKYLEKASKEGKSLLEISKAVHNLAKAEKSKPKSSIIKRLFVAVIFAVLVGLSVYFRKEIQAKVIEAKDQLAQLPLFNKASA